MENTKQTKGQTLLRLFLSTLYISAFTFGGGFVIVTFMKRKFVDELHWIDENEMLDLAALAQASPGAIAVNAAILVGWHTAGLAGMVTAVAGTLIPPMLILSVISVFYETFASNTFVALVLKGMQFGAAAVIFDVVCDLGGNVIRQHRPLPLIIMAGAFAANVVFHVNAAAIVLACAALGMFLAIINRRHGENAGGGVRT